MKHQILTTTVCSLQQNENIDTTQVIWNASATDADGDDVTYSLGGNDADAFEIDENSGAVTFAESLTTSLA